MTQLVFDFSRRTLLSRSDFIVSGSNTAALAWIDRWPDWPSHALLVWGPQHSGKTHLACLWSERAAAALVRADQLQEARLACLLDRAGCRIAVDGADRAPEAALLHLFNACSEGGGSLLLTARLAPGSWRPVLPDLGSRLRAALAIGIGPPDDALLAAILVKHFADRQVRVAAEVIAYLVGHMERSFAAAAEIAAALDTAALSRGGAVTVPLAHHVLAELNLQSPPPDSDPAVR